MCLGVRCIGGRGPSHPVVKVIVNGKGVSPVGCQGNLKCIGLRAKGICCVYVLYIQYV